MNKLPLEKRCQILHCLVEGNSLRSTSRLVDCSINTVIKLLIEVGEACSIYQNQILRNLSCKRIKVDEIWSFCYSKQKNVENIKNLIEGAGSVWTWTAICSQTKLVLSWIIGGRDAETARLFIKDLSSRLNNKIQLNSDGFKLYIDAIDEVFGSNIDYGRLVKLYGEDHTSEKAHNYDRYKGAKKEIISGTPEIDKISTSHIERQNLTMRMGMRRFTRKTNGFSKKIENHIHAISLHFMYYNFCRIHKTLRVTPAMEAGISDHIWNFEEILNLLNSN